MLGFELLSFLGKGAFGQVYLARRQKTNDLYALKIVHIKPGWDEEKLSSIKNEHEIFKKIAGDHLVKAPFSFQEGMVHFFVMDFMPAGDFSALLGEEVYLEEQAAKFYIAEIVLAIQHLHNYDIIHRDLKPENLVIDGEGHLKLTDFGLSEMRMEEKLTEVRKVNQTETVGHKHKRSMLRRKALVSGNKKSDFRLVGTPDYIAP